MGKEHDKNRNRLLVPQEEKDSHAAYTYVLNLYSLV